MLVIRFSRTGKKNHAQYRVVLADKTSPVKGRFVELLGSYDPHLKKASLKVERIKYWIGQGATASPSAHNLFVSQGIVEGAKQAIKMEKPKKPEVKAPEEEVKKEAVPAETPAPISQEKPAEEKPAEEKPAPEEEKKAE